MNEILIAILVGVVLTPVGVYFTYRYMGKSALSKISQWNAAMSFVYCVMYFIVGKLGAIHLLWAVPTSYGLGRILNVMMKKMVNEPLNAATKNVNELAEGKLTIIIDKKLANKDHDLGLLIRSIDQLANKLKEVIGGMNENANNLLSVSDNLASTAQNLSTGSSEQASSTEEISSSMEEMASNIQQNTENARLTEKMARSAAMNAEKVKLSSDQSMDSIKRISEKITIINDIAFQTNILALNAAVEAARAGESGRGFAVVAAEVRKLAERSKVAADEINVLSSGSVRITEEAGSLLNQLIPEIQQTSRLVQEITAASLEQSSGADQINNALQQLSRVTQQTATTSEEMASNADELRIQSMSLQQLGSYFQGY
jgi:methyl-accepting chemotaxis protein